MSASTTMGRMALTDRLQSLLAQLDSYMQFAGKTNLTSAHVVAETTAMGLLNRVWGWELVNANTDSQNSPGIDLIDEGQSIAVQVTTTRTVEKVRHTLKEVVREGVVYKKLIVLLLTCDDPTQGMRDCTDPAYPGPLEVWSLADVFRKAISLDMDTLGGIVRYLEAEKGSFDPEREHLELPATSALEESGFVGRQEELAEIRRRFGCGDHMVVLSGLGGMGKTELALRYARKHPGPVFFTRFDGSFTHTLANMALGIRPRLPDGELSRDESELAKRVLSLLERSGENDLLILDNVDSKTGLLDDLLEDPVFERIHDMKLKLLLTTRSAWDDVIRVEPMPEEPLRGIFRRHGAHVTEQEMKDLIDAVGGHTLTIDLIARTLNGRGWRKVTAAMLLQALQDHSLRDQKYLNVKSHYKQSPKQAQIYQHLSVVFDVSGMAGADHAVLRCAALLPENGMDSELFGCSLREEEQEALWLLLERGWLERKGDLLTIHPIVRLVCLTELEPTDEGCGDFLNALIGQYDETDFQLEKHRQMAQLLTNASDTLADARGHWALKAGERWRNIGAFNLSHEYSLRAMERIEAHPSPDAPDLAQAYNNVGVTYGDLGDHRKALEYQQKALTIRGNVLSAGHPDLAMSYNNVGNTYGDLGEHRKALEFKQKALAICEKSLPPEHPNLAATYNNVGSTYGSLSNHRKALEYQQKALTIWKKILPPEHPNLASSYNNVGTTYYNLGDHRKALEYLQKALTIRKKVLPPEHPDLARSYNNVGMTYVDLGNHRKALEYLQKALTIRKKVLPPEHPDLSASLANIACTYHDLGKFSDAARSMHQAAEGISRSSLPEDHPDKAAILQLAVQFEKDAAMQQAISMAMQGSGPASPRFTIPKK